jgi:hypothetical protein
VAFEHYFYVRVLAKYLGVELGVLAARRIEGRRIKVKANVPEYSTALGSRNAPFTKARLSVRVKGRF